MRADKSIDLPSGALSGKVFLRGYYCAIVVNPTLHDPSERKM